MKIISKIFFTLLSLGVASPVFAEDPPTLASGIDSIVDRVLGYILPVAGLACVVFVIIGGYMWITSAGDPAKVKQAQGTLTWAIIGLVFIIISVAVISMVKGAVS